METEIEHQHVDDDLVLSARFHKIVESLKLRIGLSRLEFLRFWAHRRQNFSRLVEDFEDPNQRYKHQEAETNFEEKWVPVRGGVVHLLDKVRHYEQTYEYESSSEYQLSIKSSFLELKSLVDVPQCVACVRELQKYYS